MNPSSVCNSKNASIITEEGAFMALFFAYTKKISAQKKHHNIYVTLKSFAERNQFYARIKRICNKDDLSEKR